MRLPTLVVVVRLAPLVPLLLSACNDGATRCDTEKNRIAGELVQCHNNATTLKDEIAGLKAQVERLKAAASAPPATEAAPVAVNEAQGKRHGARHGATEESIPPEEITRVVGAGASQLRICYQKALKHNPNIQTIATVRAAFNIRPAGQVFGATIAPHVDAEMERCMLRFIERWRFPAFHGDSVRIETPVNLVAH